mmetsp:Transcript_25668/g.32355  ORF Transcript_25668/g.32355 Transcript_25668/m.32355 type:complete len:82 (-) Transcript_25668:18-263(-)
MCYSLCYYKYKYVLYEALLFLYYEIFLEFSDRSIDHNASFCLVQQQVQVKEQVLVPGMPSRVPTQWKESEKQIIMIILQHV